MNKVFSNIKIFLNKNWTFWILLVIPYLILFFTFRYYQNTIRKIPESKIIIIDKGSLLLNVVSYSGKIMASYPVSVGENFGNKKVIGDKRTPEGIFKIISIEDSKDWEFDFDDDTLGLIKGAYGPWFIRLDTDGFKGIGIHGTHDKNTVKKRTTNGCIRMDNDDIDDLKNMVVPGLMVLITPSILDTIGRSDVK